MDIEEYRGFTIQSQPGETQGDTVAFEFHVSRGRERELVCRCEVAREVLAQLDHDLGRARERCLQAIRHVLDRDEYIKGESFTLAITSFGMHRG